MINLSWAPTDDQIEIAHLVDLASDLYIELEGCLAILEHEFGDRNLYARDIAATRTALAKAKGAL